MGIWICWSVMLFFISDIIFHQWHHESASDVTLVTSRRHILQNFKYRQIFTDFLKLWGYVKDIISNYLPFSANGNFQTLTFVSLWKDMFCPQQTPEIRYSIVSTYCIHAIQHVYSKVRLLTKNTDVKRNTQVLWPFCSTKGNNKPKLGDWVNFIHWVP